jgi:hypothetical protein
MTETDDTKLQPHERCKLAAVVLKSVLSEFSAPWMSSYYGDLQRTLADMKQRTAAWKRQEANRKKNIDFTEGR